MVKKDISKEAFERWTLKAKEKWNKKWLKYGLC
jgi:hypothetical protein